MGLAESPGDSPLHITVATPGNRVATAEAGDKRFAPFLQHAPGFPVGGTGRVAGRRWHQGRKRPGSGFVIRCWKWGFVGGYFGRSEEHTSELQSRENLVCRL